MAEARRRSRSEWEVLCSRFTASGLSAPAFAARAGVNPRTLVWWRSRLRRDGTRGPQARFLEVVTDAQADEQGSSSLGCRVLLGELVVELDPLPPSSWLRELAERC